MLLHNLNRPGDMPAGFDLIECANRRLPNADGAVRVSVPFHHDTLTSREEQSNHGAR